MYIVITLIVLLVPALLAGRVAAKRGRGSWRWAFAGLVIHLLAVLLVLLLPAKRPVRRAGFTMTVKR